MSNRDLLQPAFRSLPRWLLVAMTIASLPAFLLMGVLIGVIEAIEAWLSDLDISINIDQD